MKKNTKFTKSIRKWVRKRMYGFDLIYNNGNSKIKVCRFITGRFCAAYIDENGVKTSIATDIQRHPRLQQIHFYMYKFDSKWDKAFILLRKLCHSDKRFTIEYQLKLKIFRYES